MTGDTPSRPPGIGEVDPKKLSVKRQPRKLDLGSFPDQPPTNYSGLPGTAENYAFLLSAFNITARFNVISKRPEVIIPGWTGTVENAANTSITAIQSLAARHGLPTGPVQAMLDLLADENPYNPVRTWIESVPWDGEDRLPALCATLVTEPDFPVGFKDRLIYKWLLSAVAAVLTLSGFHTRGVITLLGPQGIGKTTWVRNLVPDEILSAAVVRLDHHLDATNKDSILIAISHWIVEIGELESSFKREVGRLKGFLTLDRDKVRRPYGKEAAEYPRRTVFAASVNGHDFLQDSTGNSRFWTLPLIDVDHEHGINMQQVFAQLAVDFHKGEQWWLDAMEEAELAYRNEKHRSFSLVIEKLQGLIDFEAREGGKALTATEILEKAGLERPTNPQAKECAAYLRERLGPPKRSQGRDKYRVVLRPEALRSDFDGTPDEDEMEEEEFDPALYVEEPEEPAPAPQRPKPKFG
jgi:putative DNA primase/helicase